MSKLSRGQKGEEIVSDILNSIKEYHYLLNNVTFKNKRSEMTHQIDHILIHPHGVFVIETKNYYGTISGNKDDIYWIKTFNKRGKIVKEKFMNPIKQNNAHIRYIKKIIGKDIPIINFVVFVNNDVSHLGIYTVTNLDQLLNRIINWESDTSLSSKQMNDINRMLLYLEADMQNEDHVNNIKEMRRRRKGT